MKRIAVVIVALLMLTGLVGCGISKGYVNDRIGESEGRTNARIDAVANQADGNTREVARLNELTQELDKKTNLALNKVKGFENYVVIWSGEINFDFDSFELTSAAQSILDEAADQMLLNPGSIMEIGGHTDAAGSKTYNMMLGERRANSAKSYLAAHAPVHLYRLQIVSFGEDKPTAMSDSRSSASRNRRVTLQLWGDSPVRSGGEASIN